MWHIHMYCTCRKLVFSDHRQEDEINGAKAFPGALQNIQKNNQQYNKLVAAWCLIGRVENESVTLI